MKRNSTITIVQFVFSLVAMLLIQITNAQIVYTDVNPDATSTSTYNLDLNNDGTIDFVIAHTSTAVKGSGKCKGQKGSNEYIKVTPLNGNQVLDTGMNAKMIVLNQTIDASVTTWGSSIDQVLYTGEHKCAQFCVFGYCSYSFYPFGTGEWAPGVEDGFLGLRLIYGGHSYFGWVRISISPWTNGSVNGFTPKDYAFNSQPDKAILAGQSLTQYLGINPLPDLNVHFCAGNNIPVPYVIAGSFSAGNIVTAQLSDATGSFANPVAVGNVISKASGTINALIPALTPSGDGYSIRVVSSDPVRTSISTPLNAHVHGGLPEPLIGTLYPTYLCESPNVYLAVSPHEFSAEVCYTFQWKLNGNPIPGATSQFYTATEVGNYTCVISNAAGTVTSNVITISSERPASIISNSGSETVTLSNIGALGTFQWKLNGNDIPYATAQNYVATLSGDYACSVTNSCGTFISNTIPVAINPPIADAIITASGPTAICSGTVVLNANTGSGLSYQWYDASLPYSTNNPKIIPGATSSSYAASVTGIYLVRETNSVGYSRESNYIITLIGNPHPTIYSSSVTVCQGSPVNLYAEPAEYVTPPNTYSYQWIKDSVDISNGTNQNYTAKKPGTYSVRVTLNSGGCSGTSAGVQITSCSNSTTIASSNSFQKEIPVLADDFHSLSIAPNPVFGSAKISFMLKKSEKVSLTVYDMAGRLIKKIADNEYNEGTHQVSLNVKDIGSGIYFLKIQSGEILQSKKFIVMH